MKKQGSTWGRLCDSLFNVTRCRGNERKNRRLRIDPLEERTLLSVSPADIVANLVNSVSSTGAAATVGAQSVAMDENGDFVVAWTRTDLVYDSSGDRVIDPETEDYMVESNIYARYFTNEVQQIELPEDVLLDGSAGSFATADIDYGGNEVQLLSFTSATWTEIQEDFGAVSSIAGSFRLWLDVNVDGVQDVGEVTDTIDFDEAFFNSTDPAVEDQATRIQDALQALGGALADVVVTGIDSQNFTISFGDASGGVDQDLLVAVDQSFGGGNLSSASVSPVLEPFTVTFSISPNDPSLTAQSIEDAFQTLYYNRFQATTNTARPDNDGVNVLRTAIPTVSVTSVKTADDPNGLRTFNIEFTGDSALTDVPTMVVSSVEDEAGNVLVSAATAFQATTIKEPSPEFRVNPEEPDNPFTALPDKYDQYNACVAMDADGDFIITWESEIPDAHNSGSVTDIFARLFQPVGIVDIGDAEHGAGIWEVDLDNDGVAETQIQGVRPVEVAVPYSALLSNTSPFKVADDLYTFRANEYTTNAQSNPSVAMDSKGNFAISWSSGGQDISYFNSIYVRSFSSDGAPINAVEVMVNEEVTDRNDDSFVTLSDDGYFAVAWVQSNTAYSRLDVKLYDPDCTVALDQFIVASAGSGQLTGPSAAFDTANNFFVGWTQVSADFDNNGQRSIGYYATEYDVTGVQIRPTLRANSANLSANTLTSWPLDQYNGQVVMDADGDLTIIYEGFAPDVSENAGLGNPRSRAVLLVQDMFRLEENADLAALIPVLSPMFTLPLPMMLGGGNTSGDVDGVIEEMLLMAIANGATQSQVGRIYSIFDDAVGLLRGEADGIMYSQFDTDPNLAQPNVLNSDTVVNSFRDGNNTRFAVSCSFYAADGDFTFQITNDVTGQTMLVTLEPVYINKVLNPDMTVGAFDEQMEEALSEWGINWNTSDYEGLVDIRYMSAAEATARNDSYWPLQDFYGGMVHAVNPDTQFIWEFTFQGELHDTSISMVYRANSLADANGNALDDLGIPPPEFVGMPVYTTSGLQTGTVQHDSSVAITADGDFVVVYTEDEKNAAGEVTNQNIYYRFYNESTETAGPTVASVETTDGQNLDGTQVYEADGVTYIVISMSEKMYDNATSTGDAVTNTDNYVLYNASGNVINGAVTAVHYGLNETVNLNRMATDDPATYGSFSVLSSLPSNKYEIVLVIDANGTAAGVTSLGTGTYSLELLSPIDSTASTIGRSGLRDAAGTPLNRTGYVPDGENTSITFSLLVGSDTTDLTGTEILVNATTTGVQTTSSTYNSPTGTQYNNRTVAVDADGDYVVVWVSYGQDGDSDSMSDNYDVNYATSAGVYMQMFDSEGHALTAETLVNTYTIGNQTDCAVAIDADGDFVVVWVGEGQDSGGSSGIYGQRFDSMGGKIGGEFHVNSNDNGDQISPSVAMDSDGNFVVAWASVGQAGSAFYNTIRAQSYSSDGTMLTSEFAVNDNVMIDVSEAHPQVALSDSGFFVVTWSAPTAMNNGLVTDTGIMAKFIGLNGTALSAEAQVNTSTGASGLNSATLRSARNAQVAVNRTGNLAVVAWEGYSDSNEDYDIYFMYYQISTDGELTASSQFQANVTIGDEDAQNYSLYAGDQVNASVAIDANDNFIITWNGNGVETDALNPANALDIANADAQGVWARTFITFAPTSTQERINVTSAGYQGLASVGMTTAGDAVVVWSGNGSGDTRGVYSKIVNEPTDTAGPVVTDFLLPDGTPVATSGQVTQQLASVIVTFDEAMYDNLAHTGDAVTNPNNYALLVDGVEIVGGISQVFYGLDVAYYLSPEYGLNAQETNKYQAVLVVDANGTGPGLPALTNGQYQIVVKDNLRDKAGNPLYSTGLFPNGGAMSSVIYVNVPTGQETLVSDGVFQYPADGEGQYTYATTADSVAADADGDFVVAWTDTTPGQEGVWVQMYQQTSVLETDGSRTTTTDKLGVAILVSDQLNASDISVARDADGDFIVTWSAWSAETSWDVYAQRFDATGTALGSMFRVNSYTTSVQRYSAVAADVDGDFVITWQSLGQDGSGYGVYAKRFSNTGEIVNGADETQQITFTGGFTGTFRIRWDDDGNTATPDKVTGAISYGGNAFSMAENVENALKAIGADVEVIATSVDVLTIRFVGDSGEGDVKSLWVSNADIVKTGGGASAEIITKTIGNGQSGEFIVNETTEGNQMYPDIAMDADSDFVITWTGTGQDGDPATDSNIYARQFVGNYAFWTADGSTDGTTVNSNVQTKVSTTDDPGDHIVPPDAGISGVVQIETFDSWGSGVLLAGSNFILTAAHVVWWDALNSPMPSEMVEVHFDMPGGRVTVQATQIIVHPGYTGDVADGNDLALIKLGNVPDGVTGYELYDGNPIGQIYTVVGYGMIGTGATGATDDNLNNLKLIGQNRFEANGSLADYPDSLLISDFDSGEAENDALGIVYGLNDLGLGDNEALSASGDSGGPLFVDGKIAAIVSFGFSEPGAWDVTVGVDSSFGEFDADTNVQPFADWINNVTQYDTSEFLVNADDILGYDDDGNVTAYYENQSGVQAHSSVAMDDDGDYVIVWTSYGHDGIGNGYGAGVDGLNGVYARRYESDGTIASDAFQVNQTGENDQQNARVSMDADGDFIVAWESFQDGSPADSFGIYARFYARTSEVQYEMDVYENAPLAFVGTNPLLGMNGEMGGELEVNTTKNGDQRFPGVAMDDTGDAVIVWSGNGEVVGQEDPQGIFFQRFAARDDDAGPIVTDVLNVDSSSGTASFERVLEDTDIGSEVSMFVVSLGENVSTASGASGADSILNPANWQLTKGGVVLSGAITGVQYGLNMAYNLGLTSTPSNKYEAIVTFDGDPAAAGIQTLGQGTYVLTIKESVKDIFGNKFDGNYDGLAGLDYSLPFTILGGESSGDPDDPGPVSPPGDPAGETDPVVNTTTDGDQISPAVATDADGNYIVVWVSYDEEEIIDPEANPDDDPVIVVDANIKAQLFTKSGQPIGMEFTVNKYTEGEQIDPDVAMDDYGNFVVVWSGQGEDDSAGIHARTYDKFGRAISDDFRINQTITNFQDEPSVAMDADGDFVVTWTSYGQDGDLDGVYARRFNVQGTAKAGEVLVNTTTANRQDNSDVAMDANGNFIVIWQCDQLDGNSWGVYGQRFASSGARLGTEFRANNYTLDKQIDPAVAMDADGDYVVAWSSMGQDGSGYGVYARTYSPAGVAKTVNEVRVNQTTLNWQATPDVAMAADGRYAVTWAAFGQDNIHVDIPTYDYGIYARMYNANGSDYKVSSAGAALGEFRLNAATEGNQLDPAIAMADNGNIVAAWIGPDQIVEEDAEVSDNTDIYSRVVSTNASSSTSSVPLISSLAVAESIGQRDGTLKTNEPIVLTWNIADNDGVASTALTVDGQSISTIYGPGAAASGWNFSALLGTRSAGNHTYTITALDKAGNSSQVTGSFSVAAVAGNEAPVIGGVATSADQKVLTWNAQDADGIASASITIEGVNYGGHASPTGSASSTNFWTSIQNLSAGTHSYTITAVDKAGTSSQSTGSITVGSSQPTGDTTKPTIGGVALSADQKVLTWNAEDASGITSASITINGVTTSGHASPTGSATSLNFWSGAVQDLAAGTYNYTITAVDGAGNSQQYVSSLTLGGGSTSTGDTTKPTIGGVALSADQNVITWNAQDTSGIASASITIGGVTTSGNASPTGSATSLNFWSGAVQNLAAGTHSYTITALDKAGNSQTKTGSVTKGGSSTPSGDTTGPVIGGLALSADQKVFTWNAQDIGGIASASVSIDGVDYGGNASPTGSPSSVNFWVSIKNLSVGAHSVTITAVDNAGNSTQRTEPLTLTGSAGILERDALFGGLLGDDWLER